MKNGLKTLIALLASTALTACGEESTTTQTQASEPDGALTLPWSVEYFVSENRCRNEFFLPYQITTENGVLLNLTEYKSEENEIVTVAQGPDGRYAAGVELKWRPQNWLEQYNSNIELLNPDQLEKSFLFRNMFVELSFDIRQKSTGKTGKITIQRFLEQDALDYMLSDEGSAGLFRESFEALIRVQEIECRVFIVATITVNS